MSQQFINNAYSFVSIPKDTTSLVTHTNLPPAYPPIKQRKRDGSQSIGHPERSGVTKQNKKNAAAIYTAIHPKGHPLVHIQQTKKMLRVQTGGALDCYRDPPKIPQSQKFCLSLKESQTPNANIDPKPQSSQNRQTQTISVNIYKESGKKT